MPAVLLAVSFAASASPALSASRIDPIRALRSAAHHPSDPLDQKNVASENPEIVDRLRQQLEAWHKWALENKLPSDGEAASEMTSEELQRLRSLGYVQ